MYERLFMCESRCVMVCHSVHCIVDSACIFWLLILVEQVWQDVGLDMLRNRPADVLTAWNGGVSELH